MVHFETLLAEHSLSGLLFCRGVLCISVNNSNFILLGCFGNVSLVYLKDDWDEIR